MLGNEKFDGSVIRISIKLIHMGKYFRRFLYDISYLDNVIQCKQTKTTVWSWGSIEVVNNSMHNTIECKISRESKTDTMYLNPGIDISCFYQRQQYDFEVQKSDYLWRFGDFDISIIWGWGWTCVHREHLSQ